MDCTKEEGYKNLRLRPWSDTKPIVDINSILRQSDRTRIEETPFKWCLYMNSPIEFCSPLFKEMVRRWVCRNECFVLKQTMVPFTVGDVCTGLGLGVGGLDVNFDDNFDAVVCHQFSSKSFTLKDVIHKIKHSKAVSNMPFTVLDNIDNLYQYNWTKAVHTFVVNSLGNASRMIRQHDIRDLGLSGNVVVLQLWAVERLGLADGAHHIVFPRIINWSSLKLRSNKIEDLFKRKEICWEWFLREGDRGNSIIRATLHLEEGPIPEDDGHELGLSWEEMVMKKIEYNQRKMVAMNKDLITLATMVVMDCTKEEGYKNLRLRPWSDTKPIVDINSILRQSDRTRIEETPFKWCLYMNSPIEFCSPLFKEMVRRWVCRNECFVLKQTMVPFTVGDVCTGLGLGVGGLDVNFDDNFDAVVCHQFSSKSFTLKDVIHKIKHSKAVSNMPFTVLDNIDNLYQYNWTKAVHTFVVNSLGNASRMIRQHDIRDLGLSGNVVVLQLWAVERLGLADGAHHIVFPRIINWSSLKLRSNKIEDLFKRKEAAEDAKHFKLAICQMTERVCHGRGNYPTDFFYVYATMFKDLKVLLPFSDFQMGVLRTLNLALTQLHPNG
ncbi:hypothetical protein LR48_Vigan04g164600 [Vigna angularis]|uniref:Aminotransferase-like plant mobile domain-containing protein n=1 Tax=Phaseolus angularis TaxID=3914 RepID=A0A0L9UFF9_PHAAN|nr:hypothetical protein LR48_Vigan04g164600 [Vigna angularis]